MTGSTTVGDHPPAAPFLHHVAIQTSDLDNTVSWYRDFFGATERWSLQEFSDLTESRLPGIRRLVEVTVGSTAFHLFERAGTDDGPPPDRAAQVQHICMICTNAAELEDWREHWLALAGSGRYRFADSERATDIVTDGDGSKSFYLRDPNGLEFEFTWIPGGTR